MLLPQRQPNSFSCFPTAFAIIIGVPVEEIFQKAGHDGSEIIWPSCPEPYNRRGFHPQELVYVARSYGWAVSTYEYSPQLQGQTVINVRCSIPIIGNFAVLGGYNDRKERHAVAWDGYSIIDPAWRKSINFQSEIAYVFDWIKN